MKNILTHLTITIFGLLVFTSHLKAQSLSAGFEFGTGSSYMGENFESGNQIDYNASITTGLNLKYTPTDAYFGLRFNVLYVSTRFTGNGTRNYTYSGEVSTLTTSILLEHLNQTKKLNFGYNCGMGITKEDYSTQQLWNGRSDTRNFMSISIGGILSYSLSENSSLNLTPSLLWTDPVNTFRPDHWYRGGEDISALIQLGYTYRLK